MKKRVLFSIVTVLFCLLTHFTNAQTNLFGHSQKPTNEQLSILQNSFTAYQLVAISPEKIYNDVKKMPQNPHFSIEIEGKSRNLVLYPHNIIADDCVVRVKTATGIETRTIDNNITYKGYIEGKQIQNYPPLRQGIFTCG
ncbi:MAG: hypothetical protein R2798_12605 [Chitinophagales bacterium]